MWYAEEWRSLVQLLGNEWEVLLITLTVQVMAVGIARPLGLPFRRSIWVEYAVLMVGMVIMVFQPQISPLLFTVFSAVILWKVLRKPGKNAVIEAAPSSSYQPHLTVLRATVLAITIVAILAVDFQYFPIRFAKRKYAGVSLMDVGVGTVVYTGGLSSGLKLARTGRRESLKTTILSTLPLFALGLSRVVAMRVLGYNYSISEYGVHWNFFTTLSALPIVNYIIPASWRLSTAILTMTIYELAMRFHPSLLETLLDDESERTTLLLKNKEGLASLIGYIAIYLVASWIGGSLKQGHLSRQLLGMTVVVAVFYSSLRLIFPEEFIVSRRIANGMYVVWILLFTGIHQSFLQTIFMAPALLRSPMAGVPRIYEGISSFQLELFLLANIITGLLNMAVKLRTYSAWLPAIVMPAYMGVISVVGLWLRHRSQTKKRKEKPSSDASPAYISMSTEEETKRPLLARTPASPALPV